MKIADGLILEFRSNEQGFYYQYEDGPILPPPFTKNHEHPWIDKYLQNALDCSKVCHKGEGELVKNKKVKTTPLTGLPRDFHI